MPYHLPFVNQKLTTSSSSHFQKATWTAFGWELFEITMCTHKACWYLPTQTIQKGKLCSYTGCVCTLSGNRLFIHNCTSPSCRLYSTCHSRESRGQGGYVRWDQVKDRKGESSRESSWENNEKAVTVQCSEVSLASRSLSVEGQRQWAHPPLCCCSPREHKRGF